MIKYAILLAAIPYLFSVVAVVISTIAKFKAYSLTKPWTAAHLPVITGGLAEIISLIGGAVAGIGVYLTVAATHHAAVTFSADWLPIIISAAMVAALSGGLYRLGAPFLALLEALLTGFATTGGLPISGQPPKAGSIPVPSAASMEPERILPPQVSAPQPTVSIVSPAPAVPPDAPTTTS